MDVKTVKFMIGAGSKELDRLRGETQLVVTTLIGVLSETSHPVVKEFRFGDAYTWKLIHNISGTVIECRDWHHQAAGDPSLIYSSADQNVRTPMKYVRIVYDGLDTLIEGLFEEFPHLWDHFGPLFDAARQRPAE